MQPAIESHPDEQAHNRSCGKYDSQLAVAGELQPHALGFVWISGIIEFVLAGHWNQRRALEERSNKLDLRNSFYASFVMRTMGTDSPLATEPRDAPRQCNLWPGRKGPRLKSLPFPAA